VGTAIAQVSEFSLIILALGVVSSQISSDILSTLTFTAIITITLSTYLISYSNGIYSKLSGVLSIFEKNNLRKNKRMNKKYDAILFGYNRIGFGILESFKKIKKDYLVVDFNPDTIDCLSRFRIPCIYGDAYDSDFLSELPLKKLSLAVSTIPDFETNVLLLGYLRKVNPDAVIILRASSIKDALELYKKGASYVLTPHFLGGEYVAHMIIEDKTNEKGYKLEKEKHISMLNEMMKRGHEHPPGI
jgi:voltage-gated potassium channel Kch